MANRAKALTEKEVLQKVRDIRLDGETRKFAVGGIDGLTLRVSPHTANYYLRVHNRNTKTSFKILSWDPSRPTLEKAREIARFFSYIYLDSLLDMPPKQARRCRLKALHSLRSDITRLEHQMFFGTDYEKNLPANA